MIVSTRLSEDDDRLYSIGTLGEYSSSQKAFTISIREYIQSVILGEIENTELILSPFFFISSADRIIFNGKQTLNKAKPKLDIVYTEF